METMLQAIQRGARETSERRAQLEADLRAEGAPEHMIDHLATDDVADKMLDHEQRTVDLIHSLFGGSR